MLPFPKKKYNLVHRVEKTLPKQLVIHKALVYMTISSFNKKKYMNLSFLQVNFEDNTLHFFFFHRFNKVICQMPF